MVAGIFVVVVGAVAACTEVDGSVVEVDGMETTKPLLTNSDWFISHSDASAIEGREVDLRGRVFQILEGFDDDQTTVYVWVDIDNDGLPTALVMRVPPETIAPESFVRVRGVVEGSELYRDSGGREAKAPRIRVKFLTVTDRLGIRPALWVAGVNQPLTQFDVHVTLERVEFAAEETRILVKVENRRDEMIQAIGTRLSIRQGDAEHRAIFPVGQGVPPPPGRVEMGTVERGWFQFPPLDRYGPQLIITWDGAWVESLAERFHPWQWVVGTLGDGRPSG